MEDILYKNSATDIRIREMVTTDSSVDYSINGLLKLLIYVYTQFIDQDPAPTDEITIPPINYDVDICPSAVGLVHSGKETKYRYHLYNSLTSTPRHFSLGNKHYYYFFLERKKDMSHTTPGLFTSYTYHDLYYLESSLELSNDLFLDLVLVHYSEDNYRNNGELSLPFLKIIGFHVATVMK